MQTATLAPAGTTDTQAYLAAFDNASIRATNSDFDIHIVRNADGSYWCADEGDYGLDLSSFLERIVHSVLGRASGFY